MPTELHLALQRLYAGSEGEIETPIGRYRADVLRDGVVYEIQTGSFGALRRKVETLADRYPVVVVYPVAQQRLIVKLDPATGAELSSRRSPQRGRTLDLFQDFLPLREVFQLANVSLEVALTRERVLRQDDGRGSWRRKGVSLVGRELVEVMATERFDTPGDLLRLLPADLPEPFGVADLHARLGGRRAVVGRMAYALRYLGVIEQVGKQGNARLYRRVSGRA